MRQYWLLWLLLYNMSQIKALLANGFNEHKNVPISYNPKYHHFYSLSFYDYNYNRRIEKGNTFFVIFVTVKLIITLIELIYCIMLNDI